MKSMTGVDRERLKALFADIGVWSQATFAPDSERGPIGPLRHLVSEVEEELLADGCDPCDIEELSDVLILWCDATRRAGFSLEDIRQHEVSHRLELLGRQINISLAAILRSDYVKERHSRSGPRDNFSACWFNSLLSQYSTILDEAGISWEELLTAAEKKMVKNKLRSYPKTTGDEISEHDRSKD